MHPGGTHVQICAGYLSVPPDRLDEVPDSGPVAVTCGSGYRSSVAASLLAHHGLTNIVNVTGGMTAWKNADYPTEQ